MRGHYPKAVVVSAAAPFAGLRTSVRGTLETRRAAVDSRLQTIEFPAQDAGLDRLGGYYHPSRVTHRRMAAQIAEVIRTKMNW